MREVKFRVKGTTGDKLWLYINLPSIFNGGSIWYEGMDWKTLSQYTGLKDKNGTPIFEGDIVKNYDRSIRCVEWKDPTWLSPFSYRDGMENELDNETVEVVGNIYDNPELLEHS